MENKILVLILILIISCKQQVNKDFREIMVEKKLNLAIFQTDKISKIVVYKIKVHEGQPVYYLNYEITDKNSIIEFIKIINSAKQTEVKTFGDYQFRIISTNNDVTLLRYNEELKIIKFQRMTFNIDLSDFISQTSPSMLKK